MFYYSWVLNVWNESSIIIIVSTGYFMKCLHQRSAPLAIGCMDNNIYCTLPFIRIKKQPSQESCFFRCQRWESNPHSKKEHEFESCASASSATLASWNNSNECCAKGQGAVTKDIAPLKRKRQTRTTIGESEKTDQIIAKAKHIDFYCLRPPPPGLINHTFILSNNLTCLADQ